MRLRKYLVEAKRPPFQKNYKEGDEIKVDAVRRRIYQQHGSAPSEQMTKKTLIIKSKVEKDIYVITIKGTKKGKGFGNVPIYGRLSIVEPTFGFVTTEKANFEVYPV